MWRGEGLRGRIMVMAHRLPYYTMHVPQGTWLDNSANLEGGLVFRNGNGTPVVHVSSDGVVRSRGRFVTDMIAF